MSKAVDLQTPTLTESILSITTRRYGAWSMAHVNLSDVDPQTKIVWPDFDPYSPSGLGVVARIDELIAQGRVVDAPLP